jgi:hypothetical protein
MLQLGHDRLLLYFSLSLRCHFHFFSLHNLNSWYGTVNHINKAKDGKFIFSQQELWTVEGRWDHCHVGRACKLNVLLWMVAGVNRRVFEEDGKARNCYMSDLIFVLSVESIDCLAIRISISNLSLCSSHRELGHVWIWREIWEIKLCHFTFLLNSLCPSGVLKTHLPVFVVVVLFLFGLRVKMLEFSNVVCIILQLLTGSRFKKFGFISSVFSLPDCFFSLSVLLTCDWRCGFCGSVSNDVSQHRVRWYDDEWWGNKYWKRSGCNLNESLFWNSSEWTKEDR